MTKIIVCTDDNIPLWKYRNPDSSTYDKEFGLIVDFHSCYDIKTFEEFFGFQYQHNICFLNILGLRKKRIAQYGDYYLNLDMISKNDITYDADHQWYTINMCEMPEEDCKCFMSRDKNK